MKSNYCCGIITIDTHNSGFKVENEKKNTLI